MKKNVGHFENVLRVYKNVKNQSSISLYYLCMCVLISVFDKLIWCTIGPKSFLFGTAQFSLWASGAVNYDYIVTNSINSLLIGSR